MKKPSRCGRRGSSGFTPQSHADMRALCCRVVIAWNEFAGSIPEWKIEELVAEAAKLVGWNPEEGRDFANRE